MVPKLHPTVAAPPRFLASPALSRNARPPSRNRGNLVDSSWRLLSVCAGPSGGGCVQQLLKSAQCRDRQLRLVGLRFHRVQTVDLLLLELCCERDTLVDAVERAKGQFRGLGKRR